MLGDVDVGTERRNVGGDGRYCLAGAGAVGCCHCSLGFLPVLLLKSNRE